MKDRIVIRTYNKYMEYAKKTTQNNPNKRFQCIKENQV
jgi:hypothetical protein